MTDAPRLTDAEIDEFADDANADDLTYFKVKDVARAIRQLRAERDEARNARLIVTEAAVDAALKASEQAYWVVPAYRHSLMWTTSNRAAIRAGIEAALPHMIVQRVAKPATDDKRLAAIAALRKRPLYGIALVDALADYLESLAP